jgi:hypothetical protein
VRPTTRRWLLTLTDRERSLRVLRSLPAAEAEFRKGVVH